MQVKNSILVAGVITAMCGSAFLAYRHGKEKNQSEYSGLIETYKEKAEKTENEIQSILQNMPSEYYALKAKAEQALDDGTAEGALNAEDTLKYFALNGTNECASSSYQSENFRCTEAEEAAVMYSVLNRFKTGKYKTLKDVISEKGQYSWTTGKLQTATLKSKTFIQSMKIASHILSGSDKYADYNFGQTHYCKSYYIRIEKNGRKTILNGCSWHNSDKDLIPLGRMHIKDADIPKVRIQDSELSFHNFYKERGK